MPRYLRTVSIALLLSTSSSLKCYIGEQTVKDKMTGSMDCDGSVAEYCCSRYWHNTTKGYFVERGCSFGLYFMENTTTTACANATYEMTSNGTKVVEMCCCYGDNCNHGDTLRDYMLAGVPLLNASLCNAVWRPSLSKGAVLVFSTTAQNNGYANGTTVRLQCPSGYRPKKDPAGICINGQWLSPDSNRCVDASR